VTDIFAKVSSFTLAKEAMEMGIYPYFRALSDSEGVTATFEDKNVVMLGSNNYLGLTTDPRVRQVRLLLMHSSAMEPVSLALAF
jgi:8-amino-7-oxononanoate synthase